MKSSEARATSLKSVKAFTIRPCEPTRRTDGPCGGLSPADSVSSKYARVRPVHRQAIPRRIAAPVAMTENVHRIKTCTCCGFTEADFRRTFRFGCSECYRVFDREIETFLAKLHRGTRHAGKTPSSFRIDHRALRRQLREVEALLTAHPSDENADALLDRWEEISAQLRAIAGEPGRTS